MSEAIEYVEAYRLLSVEQAAAKLKIHRTTLYRHILNRKFGPMVKKSPSGHSRIYDDELKLWIFYGKPDKDAWQNIKRLRREARK